MSHFQSPAILGQVVPDNTTDVIIKIINQENNAALKLIPMPGNKGDQGIQGIQGVQGNQGIQGIQGPPGAIENVTFGDGLEYDELTSTLTIAKMDGGVI